MSIDQLIWILIALLILLPFVLSLLYFYTIKGMARRDRRSFGEFLLRFIPGVYGGLFMFILIRTENLFQQGLTPTSIMLLLWLIAIALLVVIIGYAAFHHVFRSLNPEQ